ncbi:hypothetical protein KAR91_25800 [Candidatus Pacearchaeota archaeon]|nr:hypothetical protein [Candidatus Pacearchaeota archaeon]
MEGLKMKYFVLKPEGDNIYSEASRKAMRAYAMHVQSENMELADELREWAQVEMMKTDKYKKNVDDLNEFHK